MKVAFPSLLILFFSGVAEWQVCLSQDKAAPESKAPTGPKTEERNTEDYYRDFRDSGFSDRNFKLTGPDASRRITFELEGLPSRCRPSRIPTRRSAWRQISPSKAILKLPSGTKSSERIHPIKAGQASKSLSEPTAPQMRRVALAGPSAPMGAICIPVPAVQRKAIANPILNIPRSLPATGNPAAEISRVGSKILLSDSEQDSRIPCFIPL